MQKLVFEEASLIFERGKMIMVEINNPEIDVDELMQKIREEVLEHKNNSQLANPTSNSKILTIKASIDYVEALVRSAESRACVRDKWPDTLSRFPFNLTQGLQKLVLKMLNLVFKDQREVNSSLIRSLQESIGINRLLIEQIASLKSQTYSISIQKADENSFKDCEKHLLDSFYTAFEEKFRGSYEDIADRLKVYLPLVKEARVGRTESPVLDIGCGRGEWIELLQRSGYVAQGLDLNSITVKECRAKGLNVIKSDVIAYLQSLPEESVGALTGFHIIEHLPFEILIKLFDEAARVLTPGGLVIFETPNPQNVLVASNTFYLDPTHRNPLPSPMIKFMAESRGLAQVRIIELHPYPEHLRLKGSDVAERFSDYFYGPQDYAVIGYKA
jgi:2-polyprenyl-3-methyl-5-hydroxy-6-metoxy-1,4-benzoquinol methylase